MKFKPASDYLLIDEEEIASKSGIIMPTNISYTWKVGRVQSVGPGKPSISGDMIKPWVKPGDRVVYSGNSAMEITVGDDKVCMISMNNVLAVVED